MSKLKFYGIDHKSQEEILKDINNSLANFGEITLASSMFYYKEAVENILKANAKDSGIYDYLVHRQFDIITKTLNEKYENEGWNSFEKRFERDLMQYRLVSLIEAQMMNSLANDGLKSAHGYRDFISSLSKDQLTNEYSKNEEKFHQFLEEYKDEVLTQDNPCQVTEKEIKAVHELKNKIFANLVLQSNNKEFSPLAENINKTTISESSIGRRTWGEFFYDIYNIVKDKITILYGFLSPKNNKNETQQDLTLNLHPQVSNYEVTKGFTTSSIRFEPVLPEYAPPPVPFKEDLEMPGYAPPPVPLTAELIKGQSVNSDNSSFSSKVIQSRDNAGRLRD